jgi:hypothetical protein
MTLVQPAKPLCHHQVGVSAAGVEVDSTSHDV